MIHFWAHDTSALTLIVLISLQHMQCSVPGGRISPSVSEEDLQNPVDSIKKEASFNIFVL